tara:strand:- start:1 stop:351 length:351 start_codon:yes stop_codon:yes gene_type:complete
MIDKLRQFPLVVGRMKSTVERQALHAVLEVILQRLRFTDCHLFVAFIAFHQNGAHNEASRIFEYQNLSTKLHRLTGFATFVKLSVRLENAEELVAVGNCFAVDDTPPGRVRDALSA